MHYCGLGAGWPESGCVSGHFGARQRVLGIPLDKATFSEYIRLYEYRLQEDMHDLARVFKALSDESRLRILNLLFHSGELCVCDIESVMGFTQTKVSRHLSYLKRAGLVEDRRQGLWMLYSIARPKDEEQRRLVDFLGSLLKANVVAKQDAQHLAASIKTGCCATYTRIKPAVVPLNVCATKTREHVS